MELARDAFVKLPWRSAYGGKKWGDIANAWILLDDAEKSGDVRKKIAVVDYAYHLQHNTGAVFTKLKRYYKDGYNWIKKGLDFRANLKSFYELVDKCSEGLRPLLYALVKDKYGMSKEAFDNAKEDAIQYTNLKLANNHINLMLVTV